MQSDKQPLKKCPFCGKMPVVKKGMDYICTRKNTDVPYYFVSCYKDRSHDIQVGARRKSDAIKKWNKRSPESN